MPFVIAASLMSIIALGISAGCNSKDTIVWSAQKQAQSPQTQPSQPAPTDDARRITAEELHKLWEKNNVLIIDTRADSAYLQEHIKGAISVPSNEVALKIDELPRNKMIVAYCT